MARRRRKTEAELRQEWLDKQARCWDEFEPKLAALKSWDDAVALHSQAPAPDTPCRKFYSNLGTFLGNFKPPNCPNYTELQHYLRLIRQIDAAGLLEPGSLPGIEEDLRRALESRNSWAVP
jgi:hypothetical protein